MRKENGCMDEKKRDLVQSWLTKALHDLESADGLASLRKPRIDTAVYHCQQSAEKAIKGFLIFHDETPPRIHLLGPLIEAAADLLTPLATEYRYPGSLQEPTRSEFDEAYRYAEEIYHFVISLLPTDVHPTE
jgi:HEPN domain-containing protein